MTLNVILPTDLPKVFTLICWQYLFSFIGSFLVLAFPKPLKKNYTHQDLKKKINVYLLYSQPWAWIYLSLLVSPRRLSDDKNYIKIIIPALLKEYPCKYMWFFKISILT